MAVHGLIHLRGAAEGVGWADIDALREPIAAPAAAVWLLAAALIIAVAAGHGYTSGRPGGPRADYRHHQDGFTGLLLGSVGQRVPHHAHCRVAIIR